MPVEWSGDPDPRCGHCAYDRSGHCLEWATDSDPRFVLCLAVKQAEDIAAAAWQRPELQASRGAVALGVAAGLAFWPIVAVIVAKLLGRL